jgi:tRNA threonylcarbamoyladenosine biosynthesis protein TsaE
VSHGHPVVPALAQSGRLALQREELVVWGKSLGMAAQPPLVVAIAGDLGAGKTTLVQAICRGYGVVEPVTSPTFSLVHEHHAPRSRVYHLDLYRLDDDRALSSIGWDDIMSAHALILVEWPERAGTRLPHDHVSITLEHIPGDESRRLLMAG